MISEKLENLEREFQSLKSWEERYKRIIVIGKELAALPDKYRDDRYLVRGCQSQVWLHAELTESKMRLFADSDALIVKGLAALLVRLYDDESPSEILQHPPEFLARLGLSEHLSPSRANGFFSMSKQIILYATAFSALEKAKS